LVIRRFLYDFICVRAYLVVCEFKVASIVKLLTRNTLTGIGNHSVYLRFLIFNCRFANFICGSQVLIVDLQNLFAIFGF